MARLTARVALDQTLLDLNVLERGLIDVEYFGGINFEFDGQLINDAFFLNYVDGNDLSVAVLGGSDFRLTANGTSVDGNLEAVAIFTDNGLNVVHDFEVYDFGMPLYDFMQATETFSRADDRQVIGRILGGNDRFQLSADGDRAMGLNGNDTLFGNGGDDTLSGNAGNDFLYGNAGSDILMLDEGRDVLNGGIGRDLVRVDGSKGARVDLAIGSFQNTN